MQPISFLINPDHVRRWLEEGGQLRVTVFGEKHYRVTLEPKERKK